VRFHDGTPMDAAAVKFSFDRLLLRDHPAVFEKSRPYQSSYQEVKEVRVVDPLTVTFELRQPSAVFLKNVAICAASIVSPTAVMKLKKDFAERPVGTGPFRMQRWDRDQRLVLAANPDHWRGPPGVPHLIFLPVRESATRIEQLKRGEIHIADNLPPAELDVLAQHKDLVVQSQDGVNVGYLSMQMERPPLDNLQVRRAIALAIDKGTLIRVAYSGQADEAKSLVPPSIWGHHAELMAPAFDPAAAKQLIATYAQEQGATLPLRISLAVMNQPRPYMQQPKEVAGFLKDSLREIGFDVTVEMRDVNQHFNHVMAGQHQLAVAGWSSDNNDPDNFLYSLLDPDNISEHGNNLSRYRNEEYHKLMIAGQRELDIDKRFALYRRAQELVLEDHPVVPLVHTRNRVAQSKRVTDYHLHPTGMVRLRLAKLEPQP
jgi:peptide/nickel transport system substrate-binding protein